MLKHEIRAHTWNTAGLTLNTGKVLKCWPQQAWLCTWNLKKVKKQKPLNFSLILAQTDPFRGDTFPTSFPIRPLLLAQQRINDLRHRTWRADLQQTQKPWRIFFKNFFSHLLQGSGSPQNCRPNKLASHLLSDCEYIKHCWRKWTQLDNRMIPRCWKNSHKGCWKRTRLGASWGCGVIQKCAVQPCLYPYFLLS